MATVIITRPQVAIEAAAQEYQQAGFDVFKAPCFAINSNTSVQPQWLQLDSEVLIVLSVHALKHALKITPDFCPNPKTSVIAVGPAVAEAWRSHFMHPIQYHPFMNSEGVIELLNEIQPKSVKILTTADGRNLLKSYCMENQISYTQVNTYRRLQLPVNQADLKALYLDKNIRIFLTVTSSGILTHFMSQLTDGLSKKVLSGSLVVGANRIADMAKELGFIDVHVAESPSDKDMCEGVKCLESKTLT